MSWAAYRVSTRLEDIAYSLMGIFDINMPLLYGEKRKAFVRLQEEIVRANDDPTILLWGIDTATPNLFASSPSDFQAIRDLQILPPPVYNSNLTNFGVEMEGLLTEQDHSTYSLLIGITKAHRSSYFKVTTIPGEYHLLLRWNRSHGTLYRAGVVHKYPRKFGDSGVWAENRKFTLLRVRHEQDVEEIQTNFQSHLGFVIPTSGVLPMKYVMQLKSRRLHLWEDAIPMNWDPPTFRLAGPKQDWAIRIAPTFLYKRQYHIDLGSDFDCNPCAFLHGQNDDRCILDLYHSRWKMASYSRWHSRAEHDQCGGRKDWTCGLLISLHE